MNLLQKYLFISLDIFKKSHQNKTIISKIDAWLTFLCSDEPEDIIRLITTYPQFKLMYDDVYNLCNNIEKVMEMFSKELKILDENTVQYMIDEMQGTIDGMQDTITSQQSIIADKDTAIEALRKRIDELEKNSEVTGCNHESGKR